MYEGLRAKEKHVLDSNGDLRADNIHFLLSHSIVKKPQYLQTVTKHNLQEVSNDNPCPPQTLRLNHMDCQFSTICDLISYGSTDIFKSVS